MPSESETNQEGASRSRPPVIGEGASSLIRALVRGKGPIFIAIRIAIALGIASALIWAAFAGSIIGLVLSPIILLAIFSIIFVLANDQDQTFGRLFARALAGVAFIYVLVGLVVLASVLTLGKPENLAKLIFPPPPPAAPEASIGFPEIGSSKVSLAWQPIQNKDIRLLLSLQANGDAQQIQTREVAASDGKIILSNLQPSTPYVLTAYFSDDGRVSPKFTSSFYSPAVRLELAGWDGGRVFYTGPTSAQGTLDADLAIIDFELKQGAHVQYEGPTKGGHPVGSGTFRSNGICSLGVCEIDCTVEIENDEIRSGQCAKLTGTLSSIADGVSHMPLVLTDLDPQDPVEYRGGIAAYSSTPVFVKGVNHLSTKIEPISIGPYSVAIDGDGQYVAQNSTLKFSGKHSFTHGYPYGAGRETEELFGPKADQPMKRTFIDGDFDGYKLLTQGVMKSLQIRKDTLSHHATRILNGRSSISAWIEGLDFAMFDGIGLKDSRQYYAIVSEQSPYNKIQGLKEDDSPLAIIHRNGDNVSVYHPTHTSQEDCFEEENFGLQHAESEDYSISCTEPGGVVDEGVCNVAASYMSASFISAYPKKPQLYVEVTVNSKNGIRSDLKTERGELVAPDEDRSMFVPKQYMDRASFLDESALAAAMICLSKTRVTTANDSSFDAAEACKAMLIAAGRVLYCSTLKKE